MAVVSASYSPSLPINFNTFRQDMYNKWRYQYGLPEYREKLMESQANYYSALASLGIPSEAQYRQAMADYYLTMAKQSNISPGLMEELISGLGLLFDNKSQEPAPLPTTQNTYSPASALPSPSTGYTGISTNEGYFLVPTNEDAYKDLLIRNIFRK